MSTTRRAFLGRSATLAGSFFALRQTMSAGAVAAETRSGGVGYGPLVADEAGLIDLPAGFEYRIVSRSGQPMADGLITPGKPDGMCAFGKPSGPVVLVINHEVMPTWEPDPFGKQGGQLGCINAEKVYDTGPGPHRGGTSTLVYDTRRREVVRQFLSLAGTSNNCAGGPTPWGSWITCEETVLRRGPAVDEATGTSFRCARDHGYNFEVPATEQIALADPIPLTGMGRFNHEAIAVDPATGIVYQTEDRDDGLIYRYVPNRPGKLAEGGRLQALRIADLPGADTRNWETTTVPAGEVLSAQWVDMEDVTSPNDDLRYRGHEAGAARFARGEGMWFSEGQVFFACTNGGEKQLGQIWRYTPGPGAGADSTGTLELFIEPNDSALLQNADNLTMAPWGDLIVCEDRNGEQIRLVGVTMRGELYTLANNHARSEFAGVTFSPDGTTLFVNIQHEGLTLAITGPWQGNLS